MSRSDFTDTFAEKEEAKRLGERWDSERKVWYVPDGVNVGAFGLWLPSEPDIGVRSSMCGLGSFQPARPAQHLIEGGA